MSTSHDVIKSSLAGAARGIAVQCMIYPLTCIQTCQQSENALKSIPIAKRIWTTHGPAGFYRGFSFKLIDNIQKQLWVWPVMTEFPKLLPAFHPLAQKALTGFSIATLDAVIATPLQRARITTTLFKKVSIKDIYKEGWMGFTRYWKKLSAEWTTFLVTHQLLRSRVAEKNLSALHMLGIGSATALTVGVVSARLDYLNTLHHVPKTIAVKALLPPGWRLRAIALVVHNIASVAVLEWLT